MPYGRAAARPARPRQRSIRPDDGRAAAGKRQGLSRVQVEMLVRAQHSLCALCLRPLGEKFAVDHDHVLAEAHGHPATTGCERCVRGLTCLGCNFWLSSFRGEPEFLMRAAQYAGRRR